MMFYKLNSNRNLMLNSIMLLLIFTPLFTIQDLLFQQGVVTVPTPFYIKIIKDIFIILITVIICIENIKNKIFSSYQLYTFLFFIVISINFMLIPAEIIMYFSGIRWLLPLLLIAFFINYITLDFIKKMTLIMSLLFVISLFFQIYEAFNDDFIKYYYSVRFGYIANRTSGFFAYPTTLGFFIIVTFFLSYFYGDGKLRQFVIYSIPIALFLAYSQTAIIVYIIILFVILFRSNLNRLIFAIPFTIIIMLFAIYYYNPASITKSLFFRIEFFINNFMDGTLLGNFGQSTSAYFNLYSFFDINTKFPPVISDSFYSTMIVNLGYLGFIFIIYLFFYLFYLSLKAKNIEFMVLLIILGLFSSTMIITEVFPLNIIFTCLISYYLSNLSSYKINRKEFIEN